MAKKSHFPSFEEGIKGCSYSNCAKRRGENTPCPPLTKRGNRKVSPLLKRGGRKKFPLF